MLNNRKNKTVQKACVNFSSKTNLSFTHCKKGKIPRCIIHQGIKIKYHFTVTLTIFNFLLSPVNENQYHFTRTVFIFDF